MPFQALHFGAGNIGRGFLGQLYWESGFITNFVDVSTELVDALHERREYPIHLVGEYTRVLRITNVDAVIASDMGSIADLILRGDIISTAVGAHALPRLGEVLARGLEKRFSRTNAPPINILICENLSGGDKILHDAVFEALSPDFVDVVEARVGFVMASIGRMVPVMTKKQHAKDPLLVCVEPYRDLPVNMDAVKGMLPPVRHIQLKSNFDGYIARKLYVHNLSHAATAYLGYLFGHEYTCQAIQDKRILEKVEACVEESIQAIHKKYGLGIIDLEEHAEDLIERYNNKGLADTVARVARDPIRKLGLTDRIIGAGQLCVEQGIRPEAIAFIAAAAMRYDAADDPAALEVQRMKKEGGIAAVIEQVCKIPLDSILAKLILEADEKVETSIK
jgi:mannitol-1-phosphate 5-dehydrogenase